MLRSSVVVTFISILSYLISFVNQLLIARFFGASAQLDAYLVAISIPFLFTTVTSSLFSYSIVPILVRKRTQINHYAQFSGLLFAFVIALAVLLPCIAYFLSPVMVSAMMPTYSESLKASAVTMLQFSWLTYGCAIVIGYLSSLHNAAKRFYAPVLVGVLPYLGMIFLLLLLAQRLGPLALVLGMLISNVVVIPLLLLGVRQEFNYNPAVLSQWREIVAVFQQMPLILFFTLCLSIYPTIDAFWATRLGANNLSYLGYGQKLLVALGNTILLGPLTVLHPYLSEVAVRGRFEEFRTHALRALRMLLFFLSVSAVTCSILSVPLVKLLFERGAFDHATTLAVGSIIPGLSLGVMAMVTVVLLFRVFFAKGDIRGAAQIGGVGAMLYFLLSGLLSKIIGLQGIVGAYVITWFALLFWALGRLWQDNLNEIFNRDNLKFLWHLALALVVCGALLWVGDLFLIQPAMGKNLKLLLLSLILTIGLGSAGFLAVTAKGFKMWEVTLLIDLLPIDQLKRLASHQIVFWNKRV